MSKNKPRPKVPKVEVLCDRNGYSVKIGGKEAEGIARLVLRFNIADKSQWCIEAQTYEGAMQ